MVRSPLRSPPQSSRRKQGSDWKALRVVSLALLATGFLSLWCVSVFVFVHKGSFVSSSKRPENFTTFATVSQRWKLLWEQVRELPLLQANASLLLFETTRSNLDFLAEAGIFEEDTMISPARPGTESTPARNTSNVQPEPSTSLQALDSDAQRNNSTSKEHFEHILAAVDTKPGQLVLDVPVGEHTHAPGEGEPEQPAPNGYDQKVVAPVDTRPDPQKAPYLVAHLEGNKKNADGIKMPRENAVILILARNSERVALVDTIQEFEHMFNHAYNYPYLFLNDAVFDDEFIARMQEMAPHSNMTFGKVCFEILVTAKIVENVTASLNIATRSIIPSHYCTIRS
jgi:hypothetical protein